jgi:lipid A ethanolaminephosphotransferase
MLSSVGAYFMNSYHIVIDSDMIRNIVQTNLHESLDLFSLKLLIYVILLGIIPSYFVYRADIRYGSFKTESIQKLKVILLSFVVIIVMLFSFSKFYTSFFREHKPLRYYTNPTYWIYSIGHYIGKSFSSAEVTVKKIALDAEVTKDSKRAKLVIMVVGEAVRADHLSLNGYKRETTPLLKKERIINFSNMHSCGTSTAHSVPCMFSWFNRDEYSYKKGVGYENVLDVLHHTGKIAILWRDNNSNSKGVATRLSYEDYKSSQNNTICKEGECRDEGMLIGLDEYINRHKTKDILIVLHQMGNTLLFNRLLGLLLEVNF